MNYQLHEKMRIMPVIRPKDGGPIRNSVQRWSDEHSINYE